MEQLISILLAFTMLGTGGLSVEPRKAVPGADPAQWTVAIYMCGSDLESKWGAATADLTELMAHPLPSGVNVVIQTGGANEWNNLYVDDDGMSRWHYTSDGFFLVEELPDASMGEADTLRDFLSFVEENYPAERTGVILWNHGGGTVGGVCCDERYGMNRLTLDELDSAFSAVYPPESGEPPLEFIGFDACLMATVDVAALFQDTAHYMIASEEVEPGLGWNYTGLVRALAEEPEMDGEALGRAVCDSFYAACEAEGLERDVTLSVSDLTRLTPLLTAYGELGGEVLTAAVRDSGFFVELSRMARSCENYGYNSEMLGYSNMVDLGDLARKSEGELPSAPAVLEALEECVVYQVKGEYRPDATGLSCYYSYNGDLANLGGYMDQGIGEGFMHYFEYGITGVLSEEGMAYARTRGIEEVDPRLVLADMGWEELKAELDEEGNGYLSLGPDAEEVLSSVSFKLYETGEESWTILGRDNDIFGDWETGEFHENFRGVWGTLNGQTVSMYLCHEDERYNRYSVPILLNGQYCHLIVVYDFETEEWEVLGARQGITEMGFPNKELDLLDPEDEVYPVLQKVDIKTGIGMLYQGERIELEDGLVFEESPLPDGTYLLIFCMEDGMGYTVENGAVFLKCEDGEVLAELP